VNSLKQIIKKINWLKVTELLLVTVLVFSPLLATAALNSGFACDPNTGLNCTAGSDINAFIKTIINWLLGIAFGIAVLFLIIGGFWYITSAGNEETAEKGKSTAINAIIGIIIIILSYVIVNVVSSLVSKPVAQ
jgi:Type IV secretion system pilin